MSEFQTSTLDDMCELIIDCPHFTPEWTTRGFLVIRNQNIRNGRLDLSDKSFTHKEDFERRITRAKPQEGDIIFTREAPMGEVCILPEGLECCMGQRQVLLRPKADVNGKYLFFALQSPYVRHQIFWNEGTGSTVSNVRIPVLKALKIPRQPNEKAIASILSSLDDKIELNRRMNETLEAMVRAFFKDWFMDFGPTCAKQEGRTAYLPEHLWSLFPEAIDEETGLPQGWEEVTLNHHIQFNPSESLKKGAKFPYLGMNALPTQGSISDPPILREFTSGMRFRNGDTLFARITPCLENGKTAFVQNLASNEIGWGSTEFIVMRSILPVPKGFSYLIARDPSFRAVAIQSMTGTSGRQRARTEALENYIFCNPTTTIWEYLGSVLDPMFDKIASHDLESRTLAELRDRLLPKLMSGEIWVKDAEKLVEDAV